MDANTRVSDLITISGRLAALLTKENAALRAHDSAAVSTLLKEKETLCRAYEARIRGMDQDDEVEALKELDDDTRDRLRELGRKVEDLMTENAHLLKAEMEAGRRLLDAFAEAVKETRPGPGTYASNGGSAVNPDLSRVTLDQSL